MTLGKRIADRRQALGWSQNELARRADVNHPTLYKIETGQRLDPSISIVARLARALGTSAESLLGFERDEVRLVVETDELASGVMVEIRPLGRVRSEAKARERARALVTAALERAGARVSDAATVKAGAGAAESRAPQAGRLAAGGLALVEELQAVRRRLDALEAWRRTQEGRSRKRASR